MAYNTTQEEAELAGQLLAKTLGPMWKHSVWENLGWHYHVRLGNVTISETIWYDGNPPNYCAYLGDGFSSGGYWFGRSDSPKKALDLALEKACQDVEWRESLVRQAQTVQDNILPSKDIRTRASKSGKRTKK